jgi:hypothetical protein
MIPKWKPLSINLAINPSIALSFATFTAFAVFARASAALPLESQTPSANIKIESANTGEGLCWFRPVKGDNRIWTKAALLVCLPGIPHCNQFLTITRGRKSIFKGPFRTARAGDNIFVLTGVPLGRYVTAPSLALFPPAHSESPEIPASLNIESKNREGTCTFGEGAFPSIVGKTPFTDTAEKEDAR